MNTTVSATDELPSLSLAGQTAVVTGGARGIGQAIGRQLSAQGARIAVWDVDEEEMAAAAERLGEGALTCRVDVADWDSVEQAAQRTLADAGQIHVLVNNAGISGLNAPTTDYPVDEWRRIVAIDLDGVFHCSKAVLPSMREAGYGRVVNIASVAGKEGNPTACAYSAAKAGVIALTKTLGKEHADVDIAVNCVTPAAAYTRIFEQMEQVHVDYMLAKIPRGRFVKVEEIASLVGWLASPANSCATGAVFDISGGRATY